MAHVRYTDLVTGKITKLAADTYREAKRLYGYAVETATADMMIELISERKVLARHMVEYVETIPSVRAMPRYR